MIEAEDIILTGARRSDGLYVVTKTAVLAYGREIESATRAKVEAECAQRTAEAVDAARRDERDIWRDKFKGAADYATSLEDYVSRVHTLVYDLGKE